MEIIALVQIVLVFHMVMHMRIIVMYATMIPLMIVYRIVLDYGVVNL